jgi:SMC interacting uncharacterized protein involved in chromosome segregation
MLEYLDTISGIAQTGAVGVMLMMTWRLMVKKDRKSYETFEKMNAERRKLYDQQTKLVREVTQALTDKVRSEEKMSKAIEKIACELRRLKDGQ